MRVFVTGATGWVGSAVVSDLIAAGHQVLGLTRSAKGADALKAAGATAHQGSLDDLSSLESGVAEADGVFHLAFNHDFSRFAENAAQDLRAIEVLGEALGRSDKPLLVTSGVALLALGQVATEANLPSSDPSYPRRSEHAAMKLADSGVRAATVRLSPFVHGVGETHGFVPILIDMAREKGVSAYIGDGANRWPAVHVSDAGRLYRLALESGVTERAYHAVAEEGIAFRDIADAIGRKLDLPVESRDRDHFGWFAHLASADMPTSSARTREGLGWTPTGPGLLADVEQSDYYAEI